MPSHGVVDRGASAGEDSAILDVPLRDGARLHDLSRHGLTTINEWHFTPQSEGSWFSLRADDRRPHGPGNGSNEMDPPLCGLAFMSHNGSSSQP